MKNLNLSTIFFNKNLGSSQRYKGFTLAEVLITLGIIGVVAGMTIPTLLKNTQNQEYVVALKKAQSVFSQAFSLVTLENGPPGGMEGMDVYSLKEKLNIAKDCGSGTGCFSPSTIKYLNRTDYNSMDAMSGEKYVLVDGASVRIVPENGNWQWGSAETGYGGNFKNLGGYIHIDVNGFKGPNQLGRDVFNFYILKTGIYPFGFSGDQNDCSINSTGHGCAGKVFKDGAMTY